MKRSVQILLIALFLFPLCSSAQEETMEERKRRITRKYLRERTNVTQSDSVVPVDRPEEDEIEESERFLEEQVSFERQEPGMHMPQPVPRAVVAPPVNRNWLLAEDPEAEDPYTNPFAAKDSESKKATKQEWANWANERENEKKPSVFGPSQHDSWYKSRTKDSVFQSTTGRGDDRKQSGYSAGSPSIFSADGAQQGYQKQEAGTGLQESAWDATRDKTKNPAAGQSYFKSPYRQTESSAGMTFGTNPSGKQNGYTPYKSSFQLRREEQQQQQWGKVTAPEQPYQRPNTYQSWKDKNKKRRDPTREDAFVDDLMPKSRTTP